MLGPVDRVFQIAQQHGEAITFEVSVRQTPNSSTGVSIEIRRINGSDDPGLGQTLKQAVEAYFLYIARSARETIRMELKRETEESLRTQARHLEAAVHTYSQLQCLLYDGHLFEVFQDDGLIQSRCGIREDLLNVALSGKPLVKGVFSDLAASSNCETCMEWAEAWRRSLEENTSALQSLRERLK